MAQNTRENGQLVIPGHKMGVIEEFLPGQGTYEEEGNIYSMILGKTKFDWRNKTAAVEHVGRRPVVPEEEATVIAMVTRSQKKIAQLEIFTIGKRQLSTPFTAILYISSSSPSYQKSMKEVCKAGDIIRARIINAKSVLPQLTTMGCDLGVVKAFCSHCGQPLVVKDRDLQCNACGNVEHRKIAEGYGKNML